MTEAQALIGWLTGSGVTLRVDGDAIVHRGPRSVLSLDVLAQLRQHKAEVIAELRGHEDAGPPTRPGMTQRARIITEGDGFGREPADRHTLEDHAPPWQALADAHRSQIAVALGRLPAPCHDSGRRLLSVTRRFAASHWLERALECGWGTLELFGIHDCDPLDRSDQWGLVTGLALDPRPGDTIGSIDEERAVIRYRGRSRVERRFEPSQNSVVWWECSALVNGAT